MFSFAGYSADLEPSQAAELSGYVMQAYAEGQLRRGVHRIQPREERRADLVEQQVKAPVKEESYADLSGS